MKINATAKKLSAVFLGAALCASLAAIAVTKASAHNGGEGKHGRENRIGLNENLNLKAKLGGIAKGFGARPQVAIGANGKVLVRGAEVTAISGETINAEVGWGSFVSRWTVDASDAKFLRRLGGGSELSEVSIGDVISFSGALDTSVSNAKVKADFIRNWSVDAGEDDD